MSFELEKGEFIVRHLRKSWFVFLTELLPHAILLVLPFALPKLLMLASPFAPFAAYLTFSTPLSRLVLGSYLLVVWTSAWGTFTRYYLNAWVLTSQRIINIKQPRFFTREVSSLFLSRVQDVTSDVSGFLESLLNIGDITVQSAGEEREFIMRGITRPEHLRDLILKYVPEEDEQKPAV